MEVGAEVRRIGKREEGRGNKGLEKEKSNGQREVVDRGRTSSLNTEYRAPLRNTFYIQKLF